ncbi:Bug family tripartite tricarboxylate transporter substrate binding protein [Teichococcus aestuarii]|uniref:Bug family tripartite tricarboxylate transporter substrate binding protein n=1 Tax=Teichococcus aestuarii TaxID=568898 RepID=UPI0036234732
MRLLAPKLSELLGQNVIVENKPGAGSVLGTDFVAKARPDGYTFVLATLSSTGVAAGLYRNLPYDPVKDLTAIAPTNFIPICHSVVTKGLVVRDTADWIAQLKANPNKYSYGSSGIGSTGHRPRPISCSASVPRLCMCPIVAPGRSLPRCSPARSSSTATSPA